MGRKPTVNLNLPSGMRARKQRSGKTYYYYDTKGKPRKEIPLGSDYTSAVIKWAELEQAKIPPVCRPTFKDAWERYLCEVIPQKARRTQTDNLLQAKCLIEFFCSPEPAPLDEIEAHHVQKYMNWRRSVPVAANREKALLSHIWNSARAWGYTNQPNPCAGIKSNPEEGRDVYIEDGVYRAVYEAGDQGLRDAMDLAYLLGQRPADILSMLETDIKDDEIWMTQGKTRKKLRILISNELRTLLSKIAQRKRLIGLATAYLVVTEEGARMTQGKLRGRFEKAREAAAKGMPSMAHEIMNFQFRDLRAKAGTDKTDAADIRQAQRQLGHSSVVMTEKYVRNRKGDKVVPTK